MNRTVVSSAILPVLLLVARPVYATSSELAYKCGNSTTSSQPLAFVPIPETASGSDYTPRVVLRPGSDAWQLAAKWEFSEVEPSSPPKPVIYLLDGKVVEEDAYREVAEDITGIYVGCSGAVHEALGIEPGHTLVVGFTYPVLALLRKEVDAIGAKQADFMKANGRFARTLDELGWEASHADWEVQMTLSEDGSSWNASGRHILLDDRYSITASGPR